MYPARGFANPRCFDRAADWKSARRLKTCPHRIPHHENSRRRKPHVYVTVPAASMTAETDLHWLALRMTPGLGTRTAVQLIETFQTPQAVFRASRSELEAAGVSPGLAQSIAS